MNNHRQLSGIRTFTLVVLAWFLCAATSNGGRISRITLTELRAKADFIAMAQVREVVSQGDMDTVTIQVDTYLKGNSERDTHTFTLVSRGGLKDFDPELKRGDSGVFFLKAKAGDGAEVEKAYWGAVAIFQENHFTLSPSGGTVEKDQSSKEN